MLQDALSKGVAATAARRWPWLAPPLLTFRHPAVHPAAQAHQDSMVPITRQPVTLLVGDDDALVRECVAEIVRTLGFEAVLARSGEESLAILLRQTIDLSILDVNLGDMTGIEVFERYVRGPFIAAPRALQVPVPRRLPAIFMSSEPTAEVRSFCEATGSWFLDKPFVPDDMRGAIRALLPGRA
jgi:CheY-like chemotaxis protein